MQSYSLLSDGETGMGDGNYRGPARSGDDGTELCMPYRNNSNHTPTKKAFNSRPRRFRVVYENTIWQSKKWKIAEGKAFRHEREPDVTVFELCARLTARIMPLRDTYPRSAEWVENKISD